MNKALKILGYIILIVVVLIIGYKFLFDVKFPKTVFSAKQILENELNYKMIDLDTLNEYDSSLVKDIIEKRVYVNDYEVDFIMITFKSQKNATKFYKEVIDSNSRILKFGKKLDLSILNIHYREYKHDGVYYNVYNNRNTIIIIKGKNLDAIKEFKQKIVEKSN
ncbi:hypothetical protein [Paramaledivibacter caminithermalis]|jgi:hypothetical protein|uniref:DUF4358 domain-containing protein n=1 Tax=Paramaledivibacter caminithermalis (strain DSM 15212 / CIP 107654 / DViRD3) TaxID=1121301 RepID=A0A1M6QQV4_PARC5|nr:hypothetical protein [Paramaledivibacter caminithermalis]SHK22508.1 hypothetical protein SAMN02745912_02683 [Paramaledivibacter caminithermalis DSM 15212]